MVGIMGYPADWDTRPKIAPPAPKSEKIIDAIAPIGVLLSIIIVICSAIFLPDVIPDHYKSLGGTGIYWSKLLILSFFPMLTITIFMLFTAYYRFPYIIIYPVILTEENAPGLYSNARNKLCHTKAVIIWMLLTLEWFFIILLSDNPTLSGLSGISYLIGLLFIIVSAILAAYAVKKLKQEGKPKNTIRAGQPKG